MEKHILDTALKSKDLFTQREFKHLKSVLNFLEKLESFWNLEINKLEETRSIHFNLIPNLLTYGRDDNLDSYVVVGFYAFKIGDFNDYPALISQINDMELTKDLSTLDFDSLSNGNRDIDLKVAIFNTEDSTKRFIDSVINENLKNKVLKSFEFNSLKDSIENKEVNNRPKLKI